MSMSINPATNSTINSNLEEDPDGQGAAHSPSLTEAIRVVGTVQGVGFRPTVYRLAKECGVLGEVCNDGQGVLIVAMAPRGDLDRFVQRLQTEPPPLAHIESITRQPYREPRQFDEFTIAPSLQTAIHTEIAPDAATCSQCQTEIFDPVSRWSQYPFTNCTHCGPRLSIIRAIPYDRKHTSMATFELCPECVKDYHDVTNRRFHAQPIACPVCGPHVWVEQCSQNGMTRVNDGFDDGINVFKIVQQLLQDGAIIAIKGIGGFHLTCDATNEQAVHQLRQRKHRYHKPFALMARLSVIEAYAKISAQERELLQSPATPIVLLEQQEIHHRPIAPSVAPRMDQLGFMVPYTPLHHLLLEGIEFPLVFTSGNRSDEPQCIDNQTARETLGEIADYLLLHNRDIVNRVDDSVVRVVDQHPQVLRRARGYAPAPLRLPPGFETAPSILAMGSELKNTFCLMQGGRAILSQHLGDLENASAFAAYQDTLHLYQQLFDHRAEAIATDLHPEYLSTKYGQDLAGHLPLLPIQHHHAHVAACMVEHHLPLDHPPVLGVALDGLGYGEDGTLWGGEFLLADYRSYQRLGRLKPVAMLGGEQAIYQPWRNTYAHLKAAFNWNVLQHHYGSLELLAFLEKQPRALLDQMLEQSINAPLASSAGRLFDAVAAALNLCRERASYEGQGAIELEALIQPDHWPHSPSTPYPFDIESIDTPQSMLQLNPRPMWHALLADLAQNTSPSLMAARFHSGLGLAIAQMVNHLQHKYEFRSVVLTGGVFQNVRLSQQVASWLTPMGLSVLTHAQVPPNDGGLSLGQGAIAAARLLSR